MSVTKKIRPSALPKLAECAAYEGDPDSGSEAERGQRLDVCYRTALDDKPWPFVLPDEEIATVQWAVDTIRLFAGTDHILSSEADCRVATLGLAGTADAVCPGGRFSVDLKSGQERNYLQQQALYALGFMDEYFADQWAVYLLYCDLRRVVKLEFTRQEAETIVRDVMAKVLDPLARPTPCESCDWCAKRYTCRERLEQVAWWIGKDPATIDWEAEWTDPARLAQFLDLCFIITKDGGLAEMARTKAKTLLQADTAVPGYGLTNRAGSQFITPNDIGRWIGDLGCDVVLRAYGNMSAEKFRGIWAEKRPSVAFPESIVQQGPGSQFVSKRRNSKK
jgi:hypothetical protein